jgi:class 3 adenylate cyclase/ligand-binding sensor domain-containing protein
MKLAIRAFTFLIVFSSGGSELINAQRLDSLLRIWQDTASGDTARIWAYNDFIWQGYLFSRPDSAYLLAEALHEYNRKHNYPIAASTGYNLQGLACYHLGDNRRAIECYMGAIEIEELYGHKENIAGNLANIGAIYLSMKNYPKALEYYEKAMAIYTETNNVRGVAMITGSIGEVYLDQGAAKEALKYLEKALASLEETGDKMNSAVTRDLIAQAYTDLELYKNALENSQYALLIFEELGNDLDLARGYIIRGGIFRKMGNLHEAAKQYKQGLTIAERAGFIKEISNACKFLYEVNKELNRSKEALIYLEKRDAAEDSLKSEETARLLEQIEFERLIQQDSIAKAEEARKVEEAHQREVRRKNQSRNVFIGSSLLLLVVAIGLYSRWRYVRNAKRIIEKERERSENLLLNILPQEVAEELKARGEAEAVHLDQVTVLFTDFKGFTALSETMSPRDIVRDLNECFSAFDRITEKYNIEKIKTIGDAYMAAGGLPVPNGTHAVDVVRAALEMRDFIAEGKARKIAAGQPYFEIRIGIHTGPVVAGIVGVKKFQYDIWGDTVNTASRMESSGEVGKVNISSATYELVRETPGLVFTPRGLVEAKGKGEVEMWFVEKAESGPPGGLSQVGRTFIALAALAISVFATGCGSSGPDVQPAGSSGTKRIVGHVVHPDSVSPPEVVEADTNSFKRFTITGESVPAFSNTSQLSSMGIFRSEDPVVVVPGMNGIPLPVTRVITPTIISVVTPQPMRMRDAGSRDKNPFNFLYFNKLQGLRHNQVICIQEDHSGALWLGSLGGLSRFDGRELMHYSKEQGLPSNNVQDIIEAQDSTLWLVTDIGLVCFDGLTFRLYANEGGLTGERPFKLLADRTGGIWFSSVDGGLFRILGDSITVFGPEMGLPGRIFSMIQDEHERIWLGSTSGLHLYENGRFIHYRFAQEVLQGGVRCMTIDPKGRLWFGGRNGGLFHTREGIGRITVTQEQTEAFSIVQLGMGAEASTKIVLSLLLDESDQLWMGISELGMGCIDLTESPDQPMLIRRFERAQGLSEGFIFEIIQDGNGQLWLTSNGVGIIRYDPNSFIHFTEEEGLAGNYAYAVLDDIYGDLWIGTSDGGISCYTGSNFLRYTKQNGLPTSNMTWGMRASDGKLWFGTGDAGAIAVSGHDSMQQTTEFTHVDRSNGLLSNQVSAVLEDRRGNLWFASEQGGVTRFDGRTFSRYTPNNGLSGRVIGTLLEDSSGRIWMGTFDGGITVFDPAREGQAGAFTHIGIADGLLDIQVISLHEDRNGAMWVGTGGGAMCFKTVAGETSTWQVETFTTEDGLVNNVVLSMLEDRDGHMWFGTRFGVSRANFSLYAPRTIPTDDTPLFTNYTHEDGFLAVGCMSNGMHQRTDGSIWIGGNGRLSMLPYSHLQRDTISNAPGIAITGIDLFNESVSWGALLEGDPASGAAQDTSLQLANGVRLKDFRFAGVSPLHGLPQSLSLAYDNNHLTFRYGAITMDQPQKVKYRYILEGFDAQWSGLTSMTSAPYGNLPHGTYTFRVKAMSSRGQWSPVVAYTFTIRPPWWKTWWAYASYVILVVVSLISYIRWRERALKARQKELEIKVDEATVVIRHQKEEVERQRDEIDEARRRSDELLLNILPEEVAEELKAKGESEAVHIDQVTVLFTDFKGFTAMSEMMSPRDIVRDLNECFSAFDRITEKHGIEKIKTIGDAYMAAGGLPVPNATHAVDVVRAALEMRDFIEEGKARKIAAGLPYFEIRIGIHTGPVVAGIVGVKKFQYDIWGDTVNTASRMESSGEAGKVNMSETTYQLVQHIKNFTFTSRGRIAAKGKGDLEMWFVESAQQ